MGGWGGGEEEMGTKYGEGQMMDRHSLFIYVVNSVNVSGT